MMGEGSDQVVCWGSGIGVLSFLDFRLGCFLALIVMCNIFSEHN